MNLKNQPPVFVPQQHWAEVEQMSKAALMDMVWDYAMQISGGEHADAETLAEFRGRRGIIETHRAHARPEFQQQMRELKASLAAGE